MRGVEVGRAQFRMRLGVEADGAHETERLGDAVGELLVALGLGTILDEAQHPAMHILEIGVTASRERPEQVQSRRRLAVGFELAPRIGLARLRGEFDVVDDIAAIGGQRDAIDGLGVRGAGLGELSRDATDLDDRGSGRERHDHRHLQEDPEEIADIVGRMLAEALGAIAALQQERVAGRRLAQCMFELARFAGEHQRRIAGKLALGFGERGAVAVSRRLGDRLRAPALRGPTLVRHHPFLKSGSAAAFPPSGGLYTVESFCDMPIFEAAPHLIVPDGDDDDVARRPMV